MLKIILLFSSLLITLRTLTYNIKAAVQNQNETYFSYLPYISACNYTQTNMYPGQLHTRLLDSAAFYSDLKYRSGLLFWGSVKNGFTIMSILPDLIATNYSGYIMYDSSPQHFTRSIILYTLDQANLTFYYTLPSLNLHNTILSLNTTKVLNIQLNTQAQQILTNCSNIGSDSFAAVGNNTFMFVCGDTENGFIFNPQNGENAIVLDFSELGVGYYQVSTNPAILETSSRFEDQNWNNAILVTNSTKLNQLYFLTYDFESNNYTIISLRKMGPDISLIVDRLWGLQVKKQFKRWMDLFSTFNLTQTSKLFPGDIVSVFVSQRERIYVEYTIESKNNSTSKVNFLCVFDNNGDLYWNITYIGSIVLYGSKAIYIYDKGLGALYEIEVQRPIYAMNISIFNNTTVDTISTHNIVVKCNQHEDIYINYQILWTTPDFPSALIIYKDPKPIQTTDVIYTFQLGDRFQVIGPDFQLIINSPPNITVVIIDSSTLIVNQSVIGLVDVHVDDNNNLDVIFITNDTVYEINTRLVKKTLAVQPCGFNSIQSATKSGTNFIITDSNNLTCICTQDFTSCHLMPVSTAYQSISEQSGPSDAVSYQQISIAGSSADLGTYSIKRNLYGLIKQGYIVSILENNTVYLIDNQNNKILDWYIIQCTGYNQTNGDLYMRQFFDPFLIVYCERSQSLIQFVIRDDLLIPQREIPLYRFRTRVGPLSFFPAYTYVFVAVDPVIDIYPIPKNCCVLRLDPCQFTVSVIIQIVQAQSIIAAYSYRNIDVALFRSSSQPHDVNYIIKAYYPNVWVAVNQTCSSCVIEESTLTVIFQSENYNFAALFNLTTTFNLTDINLNLTTNPEQQATIQNLNLVYNNLNTEFGALLVGQTNYSLSQYVCGPIFQYIFYRKSPNMTNLEVIQTDVVTKAKKIGNFGIEFIQLINPSKFGVPNLTLNQLILAVSTNKMYVYAKLLNNVQLVNITQFQLPEKRCTYYLLNVLNQTAATLTSNCEGFNFDFRSPLLTINYNQSTGFTSSYEWVTVPLDLRQIYTIVRGGNLSTLVVGIIEGPMNAATGRLYICDGSQCSPLYVSTSDAFLINYAVQAFQIMYIVMSIDYQTVQIFISPVVQPGSKPIDPNFTIYYSQYIKQPYCSVLKILNATTTYSYNIFSCSNFYYYVKMYYKSGIIKILAKFARYSQCSLEDQFGPSALWDTNAGLQILFAECRQNDYILRLQAYETINSSIPIIYTGFLQIFTMTGPLGPNCSNLSISPIKIIPLSSSMNHPIYMTYSIKGYNNSHIRKFIYSQISGILIDNLVQIQPSLVVQYEPFLLEYSYPEIQFYAVNQFHHIKQSITTSQPINRSITTMNFLAFAIFTLTNIITIICLVCYMCQRNQRQAMLRMQARDSTNMGQQLQYDESFRQAFETTRQREVTGLTGINRKNTKRPSQIEMFFVKRK